VQKHSCLLLPLVEAHGKVAEYLGVSTTAVLELVTALGGENDSELFAFIWTGLPVDEALVRLGRFDEEW
jgi:hypothetical protein